MTEAERRNLAEQLAQAQENNSRMSRIMQQRGIDPNIPTDRIAVAGIPISGVIREKRDIAGVPYATISVGSADDVQRGMQFKVIQGDKFLGTLTVDSVEQQESTGRLQGPHVAEITPGVQVRTQY